MVWCVNPGSQVLPNVTPPFPGTHSANADWNWYSVLISMSVPGALFVAGGQVVVLVRQGLPPPESWHVTVLLLTAVTWSDAMTLNVTVIAAGSTPIAFVLSTAATSFT